MLVNFCFCFLVSRLLGRLSWNVVENRKRTVSCRKINLGDSKRVICSAKFVGYHFRDGLQTEMGLHYRSTSAVETGVYIWASTHCGRQQALRYAANSSSTKGPRVSAKQATRPVLLAVSCYPPRHASGITTSRWDVVVVIVSTMRAAAMLRNHNFCLVEDEEGSRHLGDRC